MPRGWGGAIGARSGFSVCRAGIAAQGRGRPRPYSQIRECSRRDRVRSGMREFESSHSSQPLNQPKIVYTSFVKIPQNIGFLALKVLSLDSENLQLSREIAKSLRPMPAIFPFSGDAWRRRGSICTARCWTQSYSTFRAPLNVCFRQFENAVLLPLQTSRPWRRSRRWASRSRHHVARFAETSKRSNASDLLVTGER